MITLEIHHEPVPWASHKGFGKNAYNPRFKEKQFYRWQIRTQYNRLEPIQGPIRLVCTFHMPIPKRISKAKKNQMLNGILYHITKPDCSNLIKFCEDTIKEIVISDDNQVVQIEAKKVYSECPKTIIMVEELNGSTR